MENTKEAKRDLTDEIIKAWKALTAQDSRLDAAKKGLVGSAFLTRILGFKQSEVSMLVLKKSTSVESKLVDALQHRSKFENSANMTTFWRRVKEIYPKLHSEEEINFLIAQPNGLAWAARMLIQIDRVGSESSFVIREIGDAMVASHYS